MSTHYFGLCNSSSARLNAYRSFPWSTWQWIIHRAPSSPSPPACLTSLDGPFHWLLQNRTKDILQRARAWSCRKYFPNPQVRHPTSQHRWFLQQWILVVKLLWVSTLSSTYSYFFLKSTQNHLLLRFQVVCVGLSPRGWRTHPNPRSSYVSGVTWGANTS